MHEVGVIGSGDVGKTLARAFSEIGYEVKIGSRSPEKLEQWIKEQGGKISSGTFPMVASFGEIIVLATHGEQTESAIDLTGSKNLAGKLLIDTTNPLDFSKRAPPGMLKAYADVSLGETVQRKLPDSKVVKCFNTVPHVRMFRPRFEGALMLICGNDRGAKEEATEILKSFGWAGSLDIGGIENAKWLEALVPLWVRAVFATQAWDSMFTFV